MLFVTLSGQMLYVLKMRTEKEAKEKLRRDKKGDEEKGEVDTFFPVEMVNEICDIGNVTFSISVLLMEEMNFLKLCYFICSQYFYFLLSSSRACCKKFFKGHSVFS